MKSLSGKIYVMGRSYCGEAKNEAPPRVEVISRRNLENPDFKSARVSSAGLFTRSAACLGHASSRRCQRIDY